MEPECGYHIGCHQCLENWKILKEDCDRFLAADRMDARPLLVNTAKSLSDFARVFLKSTDNTKAKES